MNRQNAFAVLLPLVTVALCFAQTRSSAGNTYRSRTDRFQITLPAKWPVSEGGDVTVKAVNNRGASINVAVSPYNGPEPTLRELNQMLELGAAQTKRENPTAVILEKGLRLLSGKRGPYQKFRVTYTAGTQSATNITANYTVFKNARVYTITTSAPLNEYADVEPLLAASVRSFNVLP
jgi:photosystem II reaction center protein PsbP